MLEGKELEKDFAFGKSSLDVTDKGIVKAEVSAGHPDFPGSKAGAFIEIDVVEALEVLAKRSTNQIDDAMVAMIKSALGRA